MYLTAFDHAIGDSDRSGVPPRIEKKARRERFGRARQSLSPPAAPDQRLLRAGIADAEAFAG